MSWRMVNELDMDVPLPAMVEINRRWEALERLREIDADAARVYHEKLEQGSSAFEDPPEPKVDNPVTRGWRRFFDDLDTGKIKIVEDD